LRISIHAVGRLKTGPEKEIAGEYLTRASGLSRQAGIKSVAVMEYPESLGPTPELRRADEAGRLLSNLDPRSFVVVLDERGRELTSQELAAEIAMRRDAGLAEMSFLIGGPDGHGPAVLERAGLKLAFGKLTWPHRLVRILVAEQIYRSLTILLNHPYHRA
jgi:23S rRNA (pseudouridine1915-N3)-methyltransferase